MGKNIFDITLSINPQLPIWEGDPLFKQERVSKIEEGNLTNVTRIDMGVHTGTHIDAPCHFIAGGKSTEKFDLQDLMGVVQVIEMPPECELIDRASLETLSILPGIRRILFKTSNEKYWIENDGYFHTDFVAIAADAASYLVSLGIRLVGIDYLSIAPFDSPEDTHRIFLSAGVVVLEGVNLSGVMPGEYTLYCLPLKIEASDGAPVRAVLVS